MRTRAFLLVLLVGLVGGGRARAEDDARSGVAGCAPRGCWTMQDGCPAGTGATATPGIRAPFVAAWTHDLGTRDARIEEEPRVWHDLVVLSVASGAQSRALHVLNLSDGRPLAKTVTFPTAHALEPCIWDEVVLVRQAAKLLSAWRIRGGKLVRVWEGRTSAPAYGPVLHGDRVYALDGTDVVCWRLGEDEPIWRQSGEYRGPLALRGEDLYVLSVDEPGNIHVVEMSRHTGRARGEVFVGHRRQKGCPPPGVIASMAVLDQNVFVQHPHDLATTGLTAVRTSWLLRYAGAGGRGVLTSNGLLDYEQLPVAAGARWLAKVRDEKRGPMLVHYENDAKDHAASSGSVLVDGPRLARFRGGRLPLTVAGDVAYAGGRGFDYETHQVVWDTASDPLFRPIPAHDTLLVVPSAKRLVALRPREKAVAGPLFVGQAHAVGTDAVKAPLPVTGAVFFVDGTCHEGGYEIQPQGTGIVLLTKKGRRERREARDLGGVRLLLDAEDRLLFASTPSSLRPALERYHFLRQVHDYVKLAKDAYKAYDPAFMARLIGEAEARGASDKALAHARKQQQALVKRPRKHDEKRRAKLLDRERALASEGRLRVRTTLASVLDDPRWPIQQAFIRRLLLEDPTHERAVDLVKARLPAFLPAPEAFDARQWIDLVDSLQHVPVTRLDAPARERGDLTRQEREYGSALLTWRKDLVALETGELLILTPLAKPGRIAGCLSMGSLVCEALGAVFRSGTAVRTNPYPLIMKLYETKKEYVDASVRPGRRDAAEKRKRMEWTLGHYDPNSGITRVYLPEQPEAWHSVMSTYAHEITHHWIEERCPLFESREGRRSGEDPGYWIVEAMAMLLEEFRWDLEKRTWDTENPRSESLDVVANAKPGQLLPWKHLYALDGHEFHRLSRTDERKVPMRWKLGYVSQVSELNMFYCQAAATSHYLFHAGEKERAGLLEYVKAHYTHSMPKTGDTIQAILGMSSAELGRRVTAYAKEQNGRLDDL